MVSHRNYYFSTVNCPLELMGDGDYSTDKFPYADLDPCHNLSKDILDYNTNVTDKKFKYISDSYDSVATQVSFKRPRSL